MEPEKYLVWWDTYGMDRDDFVVELNAIQRTELMDALEDMCDKGIIDDWGVQYVGAATYTYDGVKDLLNLIKKED